MTKEAKDIIEFLYADYGTGQTIFVNPVLKKHGMSASNAKAVLVYLQQEGLINIAQGCLQLGGQDRVGNNLVTHTIENTDAPAQLALKGYEFYQRQIERQSQRDLTQSVKTTNIIQWISAAATFIIILGTLCVTYWDYKTHQEELGLLRSQQQQELFAKLIQQRFVAYQTKIDSLCRVSDELKKQLQAK